MNLKNKNNMSYTEIYKFNENGDAEFFENVPNAWRGAMQVWRSIEKKYLPPLPQPSWMDDENYEKRGYYRYQVSPDKDQHPLKPVWDLFKDERLTREERIVLGTTFDNIIVMKHNIPEVINAFEKFDDIVKDETSTEGDTSLKEQAAILKNALADNNLIAVAWNQMSIVESKWTPSDDDEKPYNIINDMEHFDLFEDEMLK
jgi:hypothetical protein